MPPPVLDSEVTPMRAIPLNPEQTGARHGPDRRPAAPSPDPDARPLPGVPAEPVTPSRAQGGGVLTTVTDARADDSDESLHIGERGPTALDDLPRLPRAKPTVEVVGPARPLRVGVVVPVHNEEHLLPSTLGCLQQAVDQVGSQVDEWRVVLVLDRCTDGSAKVVEGWRRAQRAISRQQIEVVSVDAANVGTARRTGCEALLLHWSDVSSASIWLATTDGDSQVPPEWLSSQICHRRQGAEVWIGRVAVDDWDGREDGLSEEWHRRYTAEPLPVHGASLGIDGATYSALGGFEDLATGEDRALVRRALDAGAVVHHDRSVRVGTSSRRTARAPGGFAHALDTLEALMARPHRDDAPVSA